MKNLQVFIITFLFGTISIFAQSETCDCKTDLDFVVKKIKKMPSYKKQIKGDLFSETYLRLSSKMSKPILIEDCYKLLLEQMLLVNDAHASLQVNTEFLSETTLKNEVELSGFKSSNLFKNHPNTNRNISELKEELTEKSSEDLEGIYNNRNDETIGIYYADNKKDLVGVLLETNSNHWKIGEIRFYANHTSSNKYNVYYYNVTTRTPGLRKSFSFENGRIWHYKKVTNKNNFEFVDNGDNITVFKQINNDTQYLYFKTFSNGKKKELVKFFDDTKNKITAKNVIVDLRSNSGGNKKFSDVFLKLLKDKNVYVITNCFTGSNGEQFTLKLLKNKNAKHIGQTTFGVIAYGLNYGNSYNTPSSHFRITPTDMNYHKYIAYEGKGVTPEIALDFNSDWMEQTLEIIKADHK
ncbi:S41 family peptidase [Winogradskyella sp. UBA3174]|uniref:S41 family peptidase n=1 Tax=Winogradskyella sp. UBA3174 TaxID=1947785 RepID=UPI0025EE9C90|nr:S41 family peptidase [Winogradskyella sp. UBA3174]|tara:strand:- start:89705 stop:90931 length:1227 start_codon:yes stop_codon:yes gene_type:complete